MRTRLVAALGPVLAGGLLLGACGGGQNDYSSPAAMLNALDAHSFGCTSLFSLPSNLLPPGVVMDGKCQVTRAPGLTPKDLNVTGGVDVNLYVLGSSASPSSLADEIFHATQAETAYGGNWVAQGSSQVYLNLAKALGGTYPPDEKADLVPT